MPIVQPPTTRPVMLNELHPLARHEIGVIELAGVTYLVIQLDARDPLVDGDITTTRYILSLAGAALLAGDLTAVIESEPGILALVKETLASARQMKRRPLACDMPVASIEGKALRDTVDELTDHGPTHCSHLGNRLPGQCPHCPDAQPEEV